MDYDLQNPQIFPSREGTEIMLSSRWFLAWHTTDNIFIEWKLTIQGHGFTRRFVAKSLTCIFGRVLLDHVPEKHLK